MKIRNIFAILVDTQDRQETLDCNFRVKTNWPLIGDCRKESVKYKYTATTCDSEKVYLGLTEWEFKGQRYNDHIKSFGNEFYTNKTTFLTYLWEMKNGKKHNTSCYMGNLTNFESIFQHNKKVFITKL